MSFDTHTLFDFIAVLGKSATARELGVHKSVISRVVSGRRRVSTNVHDKAQAVWGETYNLRGTVEESRRRHENRGRDL